MGYVAGLTISSWAPLIAPIDRWTLTSRAGCVDGCVSNMRSAAAAVIGIRITTCTISWVWFGYGNSGTTFRGRTPDILSESRVRENRLLGSMKRDVETELRNLDCGTATRKGRTQLRGTYRHRATSRLYDALRERARVASDLRPVWP